MAQTLDDMGGLVASRLHDRMQAYAGVCATLRDMGGLVASRLHDRMQACAGVCVCACTLPARTNETAESPEGHDPNSYQMGYPGGVVLMVIPWVPPRPHHGP